MSRTAITAAVLLTGLNVAGASAGGGIERTDADSRAAHTQLLKKARTGRIELYFLGDSITRRWGTADPQYSQLYANWRANFYGWNAADFGWGGDTTWNILWRIEHGELDGVNPRVIVLLAGTNDLGELPRTAVGADEAAGRIAAGVAAIARACRSQAPRATLLITAVPPRGDRPELRPVVTRLNAQLAALADGRRTRYVDLAASLSTPAGSPRPGMLESDGIHLTVAGYRQWAGLLQPLLEELLGPRRAHDEAPPPSRDPGLS